MTALTPLLDAFPGLDVLVVGDALLDEYLYGIEPRVCREAPVTAVTVSRRRAVPGGGANSAANLAGLGGRVRFLSVVGDDADGRRLLAAARAADVDVEDVVVEPGRTTVAKRRVTVGEQLLFRVDEGRAAPLRPETREAVTDRMPGLWADADVVVVSDYGYGVLDPQVVDLLCRLQVRSPRVLVVDARDLGPYRSIRPTAVTPSFEETVPLLGRSVAPADRATVVGEECARLHDRTGSDLVAVTLDRDGAVVCERGRPPYRTWARPVPHSRACGAGDTFTAAFALALAAGGDSMAAGEIAQAAAAVVTGRPGTGTCSLAELREMLADTNPGLEPVERLLERAAFHRGQGRRIVFTNGCFDLLHRGHVDLLNRAKALGDVLVVGLNTDVGIARLKGPDRPVSPLEDRARVLAALSAVDHLVAFDEPTAADLIDVLRPEVYVKGGDYTADMLPEAPHVAAYGGVVRILPYLEDRSTTALIRRIRGADLAAAEQER